MMAGVRSPCEVSPPRPPLGFQSATRVSSPTSGPLKGVGAPCLRHAHPSSMERPVNHNRRVLHRHHLSNDGGRYCGLNTDEPGRLVGRFHLHKRAPLLSSLSSGSARGHEVRDSQESFVPTSANFFDPQPG